MRRRVSRCIAIYGCLLAVVVGQEPPTELDSPTKDNVTQDVGSIAPLEFFLPKTIHDIAGDPFGTIDDIIIDPYSGMATTLVVLPDPVVNRDYRLLIPINLVMPIRLSKIRAKVDLDSIQGGPTIGERESARPYRRQLAKVPFDYFGVEPIWAADQFDRKAEVSDEDIFTYASSLRGQTVSDANEQPFAILQNLLISTDNGKIAYAVLGLAAEDARVITKSYPVPLAAFVVDDSAQRWSVDFPRNMVEQTSPIGRDVFPAALDLAWARFVDQQYDDGMLGGVQRRKREATKTNQ